MISEIIEMDGSKESVDKLNNLIDKANSFYDDRRFEFTLVKEEDKQPNVLIHFWLCTYWEDRDGNGADSSECGASFGRLVYIDFTKGELMSMHPESIHYQEIQKIKEHFEI